MGRSDGAKAEMANAVPASEPQVRASPCCLDAVHFVGYLRNLSAGTQLVGSEFGARQFLAMTTDCSIAMASIHQLILNIDREPSWCSEAANRSAPRVALAARDRYQLETPDEVLRFAPKSIRLKHQTTEQRLGELLAEVKLWRDRAHHAEARLRSIEERVQHIASEHARSRR